MKSSWGLHHRLLVMGNNLRHRQPLVRFLRDDTLFNHEVVPVLEPLGENVDRSFSSWANRRPLSSPSLRGLRQLFPWNSLHWREPLNNRLVVQWWHTQVAALMSWLFVKRWVSIFLITLNTRGVKLKTCKFWGHSALFLFQSLKLRHNFLQI